MSHPDQNESLQQPREASLCANNCGFFANPAHGGYCSKCYRDMCAREARKEEGENKTGSKPVAVSSERHPPSSPFRVDPPAPSGSQEMLEASQSPAPAPVAVAQPVASSVSPPRPSSKKKCGVCNKKVGLTGFKCKCGQVFCGVHRYAEAHACPFDHKASERARLAEDNPLVQASKLDRL